MRFCIVLFVMAALTAAPGLLASTGTADCPPNEFYPGPECGLEPTCAPPSSHFWPKHTCDCWCKPGLYRDIDSNTCVAKCGVPVKKEMMKTDDDEGENDVK